VRRVLRALLNRRLPVFIICESCKGNPSEKRQPRNREAFGGGDVRLIIGTDNTSSPYFINKFYEIQSSSGLLIGTLFCFYPFIMQFVFVNNARKHQHS